MKHSLKTYLRGLIVFACSVATNGNLQAQMPSSELTYAISHTPIGAIPNVKYFAMTFIDRNDHAVRTLNGGLSWDNVSAEETAQLKEQQQHLLSRYQSTLSFTGHKSALAIGVFPNPSTNNATISFWLTSPTEIRLKLFDLQGAQVQESYEGFYNTGQQQLTVDVSSLKEGIYNYFLCPSIKGMLVVGR